MTDDAWCLQSNEDQWQQSNVDLAKVADRIRRRQLAIKADEIRHDPELVELRKQAGALHQRRIEINMRRTKQ